MAGRPQAKRAALYLSGLRAANWKNFVSIDVDLTRRVFLVGPNACGKSNFLDIFRFLRDIASDGGGFREAIRRRGGVSAIRSLAARRYPDIEIHVSIASNGESDPWSYYLSFSQDNQRRPIVKAERVKRGATTLLDRPLREDQRDPELLGQTHLQQVNLNRGFRVIREFFASVSYLHIVPQLVREPDRSVGVQNDPFGGDFLERVAKTSGRTQKARLRRITQALKVAVPQLRELELHTDQRGTPHLRGKYEHWRHKGAWQSEHQFSDGTLRLMGLLWAMVDGNGPLLLEEPELSLHPEVVRYIPQMFARTQGRSGRQIVVSTHSSDLLQDTGIGLDEVLLLTPEGEGTSVKPASAFDDILPLLRSGVSIGETVIPKTRPRNAAQLPLFESS